MASTKDNYFDHFAMCKPGEFKHCRSGSGPRPAVLTPAAQDLPWPRTCHSLGLSALRGSTPGAGAKTYAFAESYKRKENLSQATTWMSLEDVMLSKRSQLQKDEC